MSLGLQQISLLVPTAQSIHILGIGFVLIAVLATVGKLAGWSGHEVTLTDTLRRFRPWFWGGVAVMVVTGLALVLTEPVRTLVTTSFWLKMWLLLALVVAVVVFQARVLGSPQSRQPASDKLWIPAGVAALVVLVGIIALGRFIAYDPLYWGRLSIYPY